MSTDSLGPVLARMSDPHILALASVLGLHDPKRPNEPTYGHRVASKAGNEAHAFLKLSRSDQSAEVEREISTAAGHTVMNLVRGGKGISYPEVVGDVAKRLKLEIDEDFNVQDVEARIVQAVLSKMVNAMTSEQREELASKLDEISAKQGGVPWKAKGTLAALTTAKLSGFGIYLAASTAVGGLTSLLGVTLPFALYLGMSKMIAIITGPVGWAAFGLGWLGAPNMKKLVPSVVMIAAARHAPDDEVK